MAEKKEKPKPKQKTLAGGPAEEKPKPKKSRIEKRAEETEEEKGLFKGQMDMERYGKRQKKLNEEPEAEEEREAGLGVTVEEVEERLPENLSIEGEGEITVKHDPRKDKWWGIVFINKDGSRRVDRESSDKVVEVLEDLTGAPWKVDSVSNFVIHYEGTPFEPEMSEEEFEEQRERVEGLKEKLEEIKRTLGD